ncbi:multidrug ABC transporter permease [Streptomyces lucensis JCM 4490]|uniref:Multidrug ABC transporter permease n=1 Tax=Streptomyces lucensis JCM 4490 TaxID=1306176 RepID=A0A918JA57_9ACTN|nr:ABC transporter permease [Streptomyces lucensis]GGW66496.1 multidrug ABC transporter permease [Streptomyces lucensis JCM 4490]
MSGLRPALRIFAAEALKQHRRLFGQPLVVFSMLVWPVLQLATTYYTLRPVATASPAAAHWPLSADPHRLLAFLATGTLAYAFFFSLVQSAWHLSFERTTGTLELLFLSPAGRLTLMLANGAGALVQNAWLLTCFTAAALLGFGTLSVAAWWMYGVVILALLVPAVAWGAFLNSLLVFSRDSAFLYTILDEPLWFVSGVRLPNFALPAAVRVIGTAFPLTASLTAIRGALLNAEPLSALAPTLTWLTALSALLLAAAALLLRVGEARSQRTGRLTLI